MKYSEIEDFTSHCMSWKILVLLSNNGCRTQKTTAQLHIRKGREVHIPSAYFLSFGNITCSHKRPANTGNKWSTGPFVDTILNSALKPKQHNRQPLNSKPKQAHQDAEKALSHTNGSLTTAQPPSFIQVKALQHPQMLRHTAAVSRKARCKGQQAELTSTRAQGVAQQKKKTQTWIETKVVSHKGL